jgi:hypothetical protein
MPIDRRLAAGPLTTALLTGALAAQEPPRMVLVPVFTFDPIPGVNGSSWATDLWTSNWGGAVANVDGLLWDCFLPQCGAAPVEPGVTFRSGPRVFNSLHGALLYVDATSAESVGFGLRFRDLSRQSTTWGTELPLPRDTEFRNSKFSLLDVPVTAGFRQTLRIYELDGTEREAAVRVRVYRLPSAPTQPYDDPDELLGETTLPLQFAPLDDVVVLHPGYAEVTDLSTLAPLGDAERLRLEIEPVTAGLRLWSFATVIHNETQHATVITP